MKKLITTLLLCSAFSAFAQTKPAYSVAEIRYLDKAGYDAVLLPKIKSLLSDAGAEIIVAGGRSQAVIETHAKIDRITIVKFSSYEKAASFYASASYQELKLISAKYVDISVYIVEGD